VSLEALESGLQRQNNNDLPGRAPAKRRKKARHRVATGKSSGFSAASLVVPERLRNERPALAAANASLATPTFSASSLVVPQKSA
jgi:hypothetical protein